MKDALLLLIAGLGFPLGAALALLILWMDKQKRPPRRRPAAALPEGIIIIGIGVNLTLAALGAVRHDWHELRVHLFLSVFFAFASWGTWVATRRAQIRTPDKPNYGDGI